MPSRPTIVLLPLRFDLLHATSGCPPPVGSPRHKPVYTTCNDNRPEPGPAVFVRTAVVASRAAVASPFLLSTPASSCARAPPIEQLAAKLPIGILAAPVSQSTPWLCGRRPDAQILPDAGKAHLLWAARHCARCVWGFYFRSSAVVRRFSGTTPHCSATLQLGTPLMYLLSSSPAPRGFSAVTRQPFFPDRSYVGGGADRPAVFWGKRSTGEAPQQHEVLASALVFIMLLHRFPPASLAWVSTPLHRPPPGGKTRQPSGTETSRVAARIGGLA